MSYSNALSMAQSLMANIQIVGQAHLATKLPKIDAAYRLIGPALKSTTGKVLISFVVGYYATKTLSQICNKMLGSKPTNADEPVALRMPLELTLQQLSEFNGQDNKPTYTALNGMIYDLTSCMISQDDAILHLIAGCDAGPILSKTYKSMGVCNVNSMRNWELMIESECPMVGYLVAPLDFEEDNSYQSDAEDVSTVVDAAEPVGDF
ncbi:uncharacterized protein LOC111077045 [Drosophila obscura]|uniref:uncharacterized protein LOC111077045 n=1 Tax=Drosophila obscura TaxID=7282 RepID=UPI001BB27278|nr:uncharacterized protein LOC111077045 [Drosophila obscura]